MALRNAYKQRVQSDSEDREQLGSIHSVEALMRGGNHSRIPRDRSTRGGSKTSEVIENAFGFLKSSSYDAYARYGPDDESDITDVVGYKDNFTFGPPRSSQYRASGGYGPTSASYDGDAPRDRRYPIGAPDQMSYDDISLKPNGNGYIGNGLAPEGFRYKRLPRIGEDGMGIPTDGRYQGRYPRQPYELRRQTSYDSYRAPYPDRRRYYSYAADDDPAYSEEDWYPEDDARGYISRYPDPRDGYSSPSEKSVEQTKTKAKQQTTKSSSRRRSLFVVLLIVALIIAAGIAAVITLHFLGYFEPKPSWKDGYDVEAIFSNDYNAAWDDKNSEDYKKEANAFKTLTGTVLDKKYPGSYEVQVNNISRGSTKYTFVVDLAIETNITSLENLLTSGYRNLYKENSTKLIAKSVSAKVNEKYTTPAARVTTGTTASSTVPTQPSETTEKSSTVAGVKTEPPASTKDMKSTAATTQHQEDGKDSSTVADVTTEHPASTKEITTNSTVTTQASETTEETTTSSNVTTQASETTTVTTQASETTENMKSTAATTQHHEDGKDSSTVAGVTTEQPASTKEITTNSSVTTQASETTENKKTTAAATQNQDDGSA